MPQIRAEKGWTWSGSNKEMTSMLIHFFTHSASLHFTHSVDIYGTRRCWGLRCMHTQLCLTLCVPRHYSPPGSSGHGIFQARMLKWVAITFSRGSFQPRDQTHASCIGRQILYHWATRETQTCLFKNIRFIIVQSISPFLPEVFIYTNSVLYEQKNSTAKSMLSKD